MRIYENNITLFIPIKFYCLTTGIIGTVLGVMNNGGFGGILGSNSNSNQCVVDKDTYYTDRIADIKENNAQITAIFNEICKLRERASVAETTNYFQNEITKNAFNVQSTLTDYKIAAATCNVVRGTNMIRPNQIGDPYHGVSIGLGHADVTPLNGYGYDLDCGCGCSF